ncbi:MAG: hypothetical protein Q9209_006391 [Squamulea sp. 1 TL-2023]
MANIKFFPPQTGPVSNYSVRALRSGPLSLLWKDAGVLLTVLPYLPFLFLPLNTQAKEKKEKSTSKLNSTRDIVIQVFLCLLQTILLTLFIPALISLPGILFIAAALLCVLILRLIAWPTHGSRILYSVDPPSTTPALSPHPGERWVFINGICTGTSGLQANIDHLSYLFGRQVLSIHNQSYGLISDLVECLLQRCLRYKTLDVRVAYEVIKDLLVDDEVERVVLVAHSQGGIITSMVLDELFTELPGNTMRKMEIYTFGSAASHFHNPPIASLVTASSTFSTQPTTIPYIEHYANEYDMVPRWGILYAISNLLNNRYAGNVFVRDGASGHMFVEHYLDPIFPIAKHHSPKAITKVKKGHANGNDDVNGQTVVNGNGHLVEEAPSYLDAVVDIDDTIPLKRQNSAPLKPLAQNNHRNNAENAQSHPTPTLAIGNGMGTGHGVADGFGVIGGDVLMQQAARGKTVKELSRLWMYLGGSSPEERRAQDASDRRPNPPLSWEPEIPPRGFTVGFKYISQAREFDKFDVWLGLVINIARLGVNPWNAGLEGRLEFPESTNFKLQGISSAVAPRFQIKSLIWTLQRAFIEYTTRGQYSSASMVTRLNGHALGFTTIKSNLLADGDETKLVVPSAVGRRGLDIRLEYVPNGAPIGEEDFIDTIIRLLVFCANRDPKTQPDDGIMLYNSAEDYTVGVSPIAYDESAKAALPLARVIHILGELPQKMYEQRRGGRWAELRGVAKVDGVNIGRIRILKGRHPPYPVGCAAESLITTS